MTCLCAAVLPFCVVCTCHISCWHGVEHMRGLVFWCCFGNLGCLGGWSCYDLVGGVRLCGQVAGCRTFLLARLCTLRAVACACVCHRVVCVSQLLGTVGRLLHTVAACDCNTGGRSKRRVVPCSCVFDCQLARQHTLRMCNGPHGRQSPGIIGSSVAWLKRCVGECCSLGMWQLSSRTWCLQLDLYYVWNMQVRGS